MAEQQLKPLLPAFARFPHKDLLAGAPAKPLPREVILRPKTGFGIPVGRWLAATERRSRGHGEARVAGPGDHAMRFARLIAIVLATF